MGRGEVCGVVGAVVVDVLGADDDATTASCSEVVVVVVVVGCEADGDEEGWVTIPGSTLVSSGAFWLAEAGVDVVAVVDVDDAAAVVVGRSWR